MTADRDMMLAEQHRQARRRAQRAHRGYWFSVEGRGEFPFDMLRYDCCWPRDEIRDMPGLREQGRRRVTLCSASESAPTIRRWASFGWRVLPPEETDL